jgi:hypothetical protein
MNDFNAEPVNDPGMPGQVHQGFLTSLNSLWPAVRDEVTKQLPGVAPAGQLFITGHSKGGGIAPLAALRFRTEAAVTARVVTFAAPRAGNQAFVDAYNALFDHTRYEYADDMVPHLPPSAPFLNVLSSLPLLGHHFAGLERFDYEPVGALDFINWSGHLVEDSPSLRVERFLALAKQIVLLHFLQIGLDHDIACGSGYMSAVCPTGVCD